MRPVAARVPPLDGAAASFELPGGQGRLRLLARKAAFEPDLGLLLVADAHLGKAVSFRRLGVPVPAGSTDDGLGRLGLLLASSGARGIVFLGDLLHSVRAQGPATRAALAAWRQRHAGLDLTLVRGNHDRHAGDPPAALGVRCVDGPLRLGPWALVHHPGPVPGAYALAGDVHPGVVLAGRARDRLRLPGIHFGPAIGLLPAFGAFTGLQVVPRQPGDRVFAVLSGDLPQVLAL